MRCAQRLDRESPKGTSFFLYFVDFNGAVSVVFEGKDLNACDDTEVIRLAVAHLRAVIA